MSGDISEKDLYKILSVTKDCSTKDICKSYRILALKYHPDKQRGDESRFQEIQHAYDILKDPAKRKKYDRTGSADNVTDDYVNIESEDIEAFSKTYPGSEEEKTDLGELYQRYKGDISSLYECIPLSEPSAESLDRYLGIYEDLFKAKELKPCAAYKAACKKLRKGLSRAIKKLQKEREEFAENADSFADLVKAIEANKKRRREEGAKFFMAIEEPRTKRKH
eukprot:Blabericola_migrator_1__1012@NODE_1254_length_4974_cov_113_661300_g647_i1_p3_GENE_NODE_1254_length_4974_cov_113_661300_g647_i1NODE_1254_length_4974_cov_113_661300_g647_i1_p3_ORF_typecomplete_len222_score41_51DnaJ/PF00226_31/2e21DnaJ/PF00226_31/1_4e03DNA_repr_REX1B/PF14966_6/0_034DUF3347/PF11827_8/2_2e03DUF3347/PF11827_8/0_15Atg14/PF10186_9/0_2SHE3/PF17078_5/27SHE3/PF17078_5/1_1OmpH/PF03938_14/2_2e03OmpH/PF03938_14/0_21Acetyltransf_6/PF13480_7/7_9e03Acetyltransf_6/PF13480_7/2_3e03Acetyltransf_6/P